MPLLGIYRRAYGKNIFPIMIIACMKRFILLFICFLPTHLFAQQNVERFSTQAEQETTRIKQIFVYDHTKRTYSRYEGNIVQVNKNAFVFGKQIIVVYSLDSSVVPVFKNGILNPAYVWSGISRVITVKPENADVISSDSSPVNSIDTLFISNLEEIHYIEKNSKSKRFSFYLFDNKSASPVLYVMELTNNNAYKDQPLSDFIKGAHLTFINQVTILI